jgi:hypothetical protein
MLKNLVSGESDGFDPYEPVVRSKTHRHTKAKFWLVLRGSVTAQVVTRRGKIPVT